LPPEIKALYDKNEVAAGFCMSLGSNGSFVFAYKRKSDNKTGILVKDLPADLKEWIWQKDEHGDLARIFYKLKVSFGPGNESWFATDGSDFRWSNLPAPLKKAIADRIKDGAFTDQPRLVTLGVKGEYVLITEKEAEWDVGSYKLISDAFVTMVKNKNIHLVAVSPLSRLSSP